MDAPTENGGDIISRIESALEEPQAVEEVVQEEVSQPEETNELPSEETQPEVEETQQEPEETTTETDEKAEETDDGYDLSTDDFAELLGVDTNAITVNDDGAVLIRTKVGEEIDNVPLTELVKAHQTEKNIMLKTQDLSEQRKTFETERGEHAQKMTSQLNDTAQLAQLFEQQLMTEYQGVNWENLRITNPAEFAAKRQDYSDKQNWLTQAKTQLGQQAQQLDGEHQEAMTLERNDLLAKEADALITAIPEWSDGELASVEHAEIGNYAKTHYGFSDDDINNITDHRAILVIRDAMKYRQGKTKTDVAVKKVKSLPKISRPGRNKTKPNPSSDRAKANRVRLRQSGSVQDAAAALLDRM